MSVVSMKQLLEAGVHFGDQTRRWNPKMAPYIFTERNGIYIIDLQKTVKKLEDAYMAVRDIAADGKEILFVGTKKQAQDSIREEAERCGMPYVNARWLGGMLTNFNTIQRRIKRLERSPHSGRVELREALRQYLARNRGISVDTEQIIVGSGAEYLYGLIVDLLGRDKTYAIESPSYEKIEQVYRAAGVRYELLPLSDDGIDGSALSGSKADVLHTTPYRSFPTGVTASASKRYEYINWSSSGDRFIVESDYDSEFSVSQKPADTLFVLSNRDNVIYLNTFSKTISPSLRVGYMVLPKRLVKTFEERLGFYSCTVPTFEQLVLTELLNSGDFERHINRVRRAKRRELNKA